MYQNYSSICLLQITNLLLATSSVTVHSAKLCKSIYQICLNLFTDENVFLKGVEDKRLQNIQPLFLKFSYKISSPGQAPSPLATQATSIKYKEEDKARVMTEKEKKVQN